MKLVVLPFILCGFISCQYSSPKPTIVKIETEYEGGCAGIDSCTKMVNTIFSDSSTETTFYVLAVYFGSVNIRNSRYALTCGLIADAVGIVAAILISYMFFY